MIEIDALPDAVLRLDAERHIVEANAAAAELTGIPVSDLVGRGIDEALAPRGRTRPAPACRAPPAAPPPPASPPAAATASAAVPPSPGP